EHRAANPVLDEATLTAALGHETARVLRSAHDAAAEILARAESESASLRSQAQEESGQVVARAEQHAAERGAQVEAGATELRRRAQEEVAAKLDSAKLEAEAFMSQARAECRAMVQEAQELRTRVLADLTRRRRVLHSQIEQLRAGRERLAETISEVRHTVDRVTDVLFHAEDEARSAAEAAGRQAAAQDPDGMLAAEGEEFDSAGTTAPTGSVVITDHAEPTLSASDEANRQQAVHELFARLRAEQAPVAEPQHPEIASEATTAEVAVHEASSDERPGSSGSAVQDVMAPEEVDPLTARRKEMLGPVTAGLAKRMKRAMQDDQNDILDRLRAHGGWGPDVLPSEDEHKRRYTRAAVQHLDEAGRAGAMFAGAKAEEAPPAGNIAVQLAESIVAPLRRRLGGEGANAHQGDEAALLEHVGSAFREWKGARMERVAADQAHAAFSQAALAVAPPDERMRWIVDDDGVECPDCDDNALAGAVPKGEPFPTGHLHPPAHPGCRCLLAPDNA
ncbi:MAG: structural protein, partial [Acidimicrobiales bacterium]